MNQIGEQIGLRLRAARRAAGYKSSKAFVKAHGIAESTYSQYETGKRNFNAETLLHFSKLLKIQPGWLLTGEGTPYLHSHLEGSKDKMAIIQHTLHEANLLSSENATLREISRNNDSIVMVDIGLFANILQEIFPLLSDHTITIDHKEFIDFCFDIYNSVVTTSADEESRRRMVRLSVSSLIRGANKVKKTIKAS